MNKTELKELLKTNLVEVKFKKADGTIRSMICSLFPEDIPEYIPKTKIVYGIEIEIPKRTIKENPDILRVVDIDIGEWRSFRIDSIIKATMV